MANNRYGDAFGVTEFEWRQGRPGDDECFGHVIVEVWKSELNVRYVNPQRPTVVVRAVAEVWTSLIIDGKATWHQLESMGRLVRIDAPWDISVKRWARLPRRRWETGVNIDGWGR